MTLHVPLWHLRDINIRRRAAERDMAYGLVLREEREQREAERWGEEKPERDSPLARSRGMRRLPDAVHGSPDGKQSPPTGLAAEQQPGQRLLRSPSPSCSRRTSSPSPTAPPLLVPPSPTSPGGTAAGTALLSHVHQQREEQVRSREVDRDARMRKLSLAILEANELSRRSRAATTAPRKQAAVSSMNEKCLQLVYQFMAMSALSN